VTGDNVKPLHPFLRMAPTSCYTCPFGFLKSVEVFGEQEWACSATQTRQQSEPRVLGPKRLTAGSPEWCPLKHNEIRVSWAGPR